MRSSRRTGPTSCTTTGPRKYGATAVRARERLHVREVPDLARERPGLHGAAPALLAARLPERRLGLGALAGDPPGSKRHLRYLNNIVEAMTILPDDARPVMTRLSVPSRSRARHGRLAATDNRGVTGYQVKRRKGSHPWSSRRTLTTRSTVFTLATGTWTIAVRAKDAAGNWSAWRKDTVKVRSASR